MPLSLNELCHFSSRYDILSTALINNTVNFLALRYCDKETFNIFYYFQQIAWKNNSKSNGVLH